MIEYILFPPGFGAKNKTGELKNSRFNKLILVSARAGVVVSGDRPSKE
jgi:hypothetical protein